jgi:chloramphenicol-sensitive protein RarD
VDNSNFGKGIFFAVSSQILWGVIPLYWKLLSSLSAFHILGFRILISCVFIALILLCGGNTRWLGVLKDPKKRLFLLASSYLITFNWGLLIWSVNTGRTLESSLGNYINPLGFIILGMIFFKEKLRLLQWIAFLLAAAGVALLTYFTGKFPWVALGLTLSFGFYGLIKKKLNTGALENLGTETLLSTPAALVLLLVPSGGINSILSMDAAIWIVLLFVGLITTAPLYCFSQGTKYLSLSVVGFIQFINPTIFFFMGVFVFHEPFNPYHLTAFIFIWVSVIIYCISYIPFKNIPVKKSGSGGRIP